eukprot:17069-Heterococcus_DN1.PRE.2
MCERWSALTKTHTHWQHSHWPEMLQGALTHWHWQVPNGHTLVYGTTSLQLSFVVHSVVEAAGGGDHRAEQ